MKLSTSRFRTHSSYSRLAFLGMKDLKMLRKIEGSEMVLSWQKSKHPVVPGTPSSPANPVVTGTPISPANPATEYGPCGPAWTLQSRSLCPVWFTGHSQSDLIIIYIPKFKNLEHTRCREETWERNQMKLTINSDNFHFGCITPCLERNAQKSTKE